MAGVRQQLIRLAQSKENLQGLTGWEEVNVEKAKVTTEKEGKQQQQQNQPGRLKCDSSNSKFALDSGSEMVTVKEKGKGVKTKRIHKKKQNLKGKGKGVAKSGVEEKEEHNPLDKLQCHSSDSNSESGSKSCSDSDSKSGSVSGNKTDLKSSSTDMKEKEKRKGTKKVYMRKLIVKGDAKEDIMLDDNKMSSKEGVNYEKDHDDKLQCHTSSSSDSVSKSGSSDSGSKSDSDSDSKSSSKTSSDSGSKSGSDANSKSAAKDRSASYPYDTEGMKGNGDEKKNITKKNEKVSIYNMDEEGNKITIVEQETETSTVTTKTIWEYPNEPKLFGLTKKKKSFQKNNKEKFSDHHEKQRKGIP